MSGFRATADRTAADSAPPRFTMGGTASPPSRERAVRSWLHPPYNPCMDGSASRSGLLAKKASAFSRAASTVGALSMATAK